MTDVIFPQPDDPPELKRRIYKGWLKMGDAVGADELKKIARRELAKLEELEREARKT